VAKDDVAHRATVGLTEREIATAKAPAGGRLVLTDGKVPGLQIRVTSGTKTFTIWLRVGRGRGASKLLWTIGRVGELSLAEARERARRLRDEASQGTDPRKVLREAVRKEEQEEAARLTVAGVVERFVDARAHELKPDTVKEYRRTLARYIQETELGARAVVELKRFHVREHVDRIAAENGEAMARSVRRIIKTATAWATQEDYLEYDPLAGLKHTHGNVRERVLTDEELVRFWAATEALAPEARACLRLHLLLGLRFPSESLPARWAEVDLRGQTWTIPGERRKGKIAEGGGRTLVLPLAPAVIEILNQLRGSTGGTAAGWSLWEKGRLRFSDERPDSPVVSRCYPAVRSGPAGPGVCTMVTASSPRCLSPACRRPFASAPRHP